MLSSSALVLDGLQVRHLDCGVGVGVPQVTRPAVQRSPAKFFTDPGNSDVSLARSLVVSLGISVLAKVIMET